MPNSAEPRRRMIGFLEPPNRLGPTQQGVEFLAWLRTLPPDDPIIQEEIRHAEAVIAAKGD